MAETVSPEATVWVPPVAAGVAAGAAAAPLAPGTVRLWPTWMNARASRPLADTIADTLVP